MSPQNALSILFIFAATLAGAQSDTFNLSSYKARYERRPAMSLNGQANFQGNYRNYREAENSGSARARLYWQELRNTDALISSWGLSGSLQGGFGQSSGLSSGRYNSGYFSATIQREQSHYYRENRFWGWGGALHSDGSLTSLNNINRNLDFRLAPKIFRGLGRIEFAEDALLAHWMIEDLQEAGVVTDFTPEDITALARTITDLIGNRTFDFRRRRIYELGQLHSTLQERGLAERESFALFAILNDNWAFANRSTLPHGRRLAYGLEGNFDSNWNREENPVINSTRFYTYGLAFAEFSTARIHNNRGGGQWTAMLGGGYYYSRRKYDKDNWLPSKEGPFARASVGYIYRWLPSSRTTLSWDNTVTATWGLPNTLNPFISSENQASWNSGLDLDYFINYQWSFRLRAGTYLFYNEIPDRIVFSPEFQFSTFYYIF